MASPFSIAWTGGSGKQYEYRLYKLPASFSPQQEGNYIYSKLADNVWVPIHIGQGDLSIINRHHEDSSLTSKGATHVHVHMNSNSSYRAAEEADLLAHQERRSDVL